MILFANSRSKLKSALLYVIELIFILSLGAILIIAFTGGGSFSLGLFILKARNFKNPVLFLISALIFRKLLTGSFFHELILLTEFQRVVVDKFTQRIVASPQFKRRVIWVLCILFLGPALAAVSNHLQQGLTGHYYDNVEWSDPPILTTRDRSIDLRRKYHALYFVDEHFNVQWSGVLYAPVLGNYQFTTISVDPSELSIADHVVVENDGTQGKQEQTGAVHLEKGFHSIRIRYMHGSRKAAFETYWKQPGEKRESLSQALFFPQKPSKTAFFIFRLFKILLGIMKMVFLFCFVCVYLIGFNTLFRRLTGFFENTVQEFHVYLFLLFFLAAVYIVAGFIILPVFPPGSWIYYLGFSRLKELGVPRALLGFLLILFAVLVYQKRKSQIDNYIKTINRKLYSRKIVLIIIAMLCIVIFFVFRTEYMNPDGGAFREKFHRDVALKGAHITYDEMGELYLHSRFWFYTNKYLNWSVKLSYQVLSSVGGGVFILILLFYSRLLFPKNSIPFILLMISGGYMQLFFGDVESYTLIGGLLLVYFFSSALYLKSKKSIILPSATFALAMTFHLLTGFLLPSLVFLYYLELRKKQYLQLLAAIFAFAAIFGLAVVFFHYRGLPVGGLFLGSWASRSFQDRSLWIIPIFDNNNIYHWQQINLLFLMFPANLLIVPLIYYKRIKMNYFNVHMLIATVFMMIFQFTYRAQLGVYHDWNLFANAAVPFSILVWYNVLKIPNLKYKTEILSGFFSLSFLHSYCWILSNHFF